MKVKKVLAILFAVVMLVSVFSFGAEARSYRNNNDRVQWREVVSVRCAEFKADMIAAAANRTIEMLVRIAQCQSNPNIELLQKMTEAVSANAIAAIEALGVDAECEYVEYIINGQSVLIDPIIVIKKDPIKKT